MFQPETTVLQRICELLNSAHLSLTKQEKILQELHETSTKVPNFNSYLAWILVFGDNISLHLRILSGIFLKNNLKASFELIEPESWSFIQEKILFGLQSSTKQIRNTCSSIISSVVTNDGIDSWPNIIQNLISSAARQDSSSIGAFSALSMICEDAGNILYSDLTKPINAMFKLFFNSLKSSNYDIILSSLKSINSCILYRPEILDYYLEEFLHQLGECTQNSNEEIQIAISNVLTSLLECYSDEVAEYLPSLLPYMFQLLLSEDGNVQLAACEFWNYLAHQAELYEIMKPHIGPLLEVLLKNMIYEDDDPEVVEAEHEVERLDADTDIRPQRYHAKEHNVESDDDDGDDSESLSAWTLRKCSASTLDALASIAPNEDIVNIILASVEQRLHSSDWKKMEAALLTLGAISEGCYQALETHLPQIMQYFFQSMSQDNPLVKSTGCWAMSRYSTWLTSQLHEDPDNSIVAKAISMLLSACSDRRKRVESAACSALIELIDSTGLDIQPYITHIVQTIIKCLDVYQHKNVILCYNIVSSLANAVGFKIGQHGIDLMNLLIHRWMQMTALSSLIFPLMDCMISLTLALELNIKPFAQMIYDRSMHIINTEMQPKPQDEDENRDIVIVSIDLIDSVIQALGNDCVVLLHSHNSFILSLLQNCLRDYSTEVRQSAFSLIGDLAIFTFEFIEPQLDMILQEIIRNIVPSDHVTDAVANNAVWALGEIALKWKSTNSNVVVAIVNRLVPLLMSEPEKKTLFENIAVTLGRLALISPEIMNSAFPTFASRWAKWIRWVRDPRERESAFVGMFNAICINPQAVISAFTHVIYAICHYNPAPPNLESLFEQMVSSYKSQVGSNWADGLDLQEIESMSHRFNIK